MGAGQARQQYRLVFETGSGLKQIVQFGQQALRVAVEKIGVLSGPEH